MYTNLEQPDSFLSKLSRNIYLIISISLLTHTLSITYSLMTFGQQNGGFISIIVSSLICFYVSSSHLTIYGISVLGCMYLLMIKPYYTQKQMFFVVAQSGLIVLIFWKWIKDVGKIFKCLPGKVHASMVFGVALIVLTRFFPLAIQNIGGFFWLAQVSYTESMFAILSKIFSEFNAITLGITIGCIVFLLLIRKYAQKIPLIGILVIVGILLNYWWKFDTETQLCEYQDGAFKVNCDFYVLSPEKVIIYKSSFQDLIEALPAAFIMSVAIVFEQFLYLEEFERRGKRHGGEGALGEVWNEQKTLALANLISGCLGGLPICINIFATYENYAFNEKHGYKASKWVGMLQVPFSFLLYYFLQPIYQMIPLFILFTIVATPAIYFLSTIIRFYYRNLVLILIVSILCVVTHPLLGLVMASLISIYELADFLVPAPAEMFIENVEEEGQRKSSKMVKVVEKQKPADDKIISQFISRIQNIQEDIPPEMEDKPYVIYRLIGAISFLNFYQHNDQINKFIAKYCNNEETTFILSLRYSQIIDMESLNELALLAQKAREDKIKIIFTGLHTKILEKMEQVPYFMMMLQEGQKCIYRIYGN